MIVNDLFEALLHQGPLPDTLKDRALQEELRSYLEEIVATSYFKQKQLLLSAGQLAEHAYFVQRGFARGYYYEEKTDREVTLFLWNERSFAVAATSFFLRKPSDVYVEVMPDSQLLSISHGQLSRIFELFPPTEVLARMLALRLLAFHKQRVIDLLTRSAWERYTDLLGTLPRIEQKVPQEIIASYLGITPWSLSRLKKQHR